MIIILLRKWSLFAPIASLIASFLDMEQWFIKDLFTGLLIDWHTFIFPPSVFTSLSIFPSDWLTNSLAKSIRGWGLIRGKRCNQQKLRQSSVATLSMSVSPRTGIVQPYSFLVCVVMSLEKMNPLSKIRITSKILIVRPPEDIFRAAKWK